MPRPERPLDPAQGPIAAFAASLRQLRRTAGNQPYRQLAQRAHFSSTTLSYAASGHQLPSLNVTLAYVAACDGDVEAWRRRWSETAAEIRPKVPCVRPRTDEKPAPEPTPHWWSFGVPAALAGAVLAATAWHVAGVRSRVGGNARLVEYFSRSHS